MFCPSCGLQDIQSNQYCRACGTDLRSVNTVLESPSKLTTSSISAREEIGKALAAKIQRTSSSTELSEFTKKILPDVEKFLETPEEKKMQRIRNGSIVSFIGLGVAVGFFLASIFGDDKDIIIMAAFGFVTFCIGLALIINGIFFTIPKRDISTETEPFDPEFDRDLGGFTSTTNDLLMPQSASHEFTSVTEPTTRHLKDKVTASQREHLKESLSENKIRDGK